MTKTLRRLGIFSILLLFPLLATSCIGFNIGGIPFREVVRGSGVITTQTYPLDAFDAFRLQGGSTVRFVQSDVYEVNVQIDDNLIDLLNIDVEDGRLTIGSDYDFRTKISPVIEVRSPSLRRIQIEGAASFEKGDPLTASNLQAIFSGAVDGELQLDTDRATVDVSGAATIRIIGRADDFEIGISGVGSLDGEDLQTKTAKLRISGAGEASIRCEEELDLDISGTGQVQYWGNPEVSKNISGTGIAERMDD